MDQPMKEQINPIDIDKIKKDDIFAFITYVKVDKVVFNKQDQTLNISFLDLDSNSQIEVSDKKIISSALSADQYSCTVLLSRIELVQLFVNLQSKPFTVSYTKLDGTQRTVRGRLVSSENLLGFSLVEDLDIDIEQNRIRKVDHRTIKYVIVNNTKYEVK